MEVNKHIRKKLNCKYEYCINELLKCREYCEYEGDTFNVNIKYKIVKIFDDKLIIQNLVTKIKYTLPLKIIRKEFDFA
jgi:hypothetical protein